MQLPSFRNGMRVYCPGEAVNLEDALSRTATGAPGAAASATDGILVPAGTVVEGAGQLVELRDGADAAVTMLAVAESPRQRSEAWGLMEDALEVRKAALSTVVATELSDLPRHVSFLSPWARRLLEAQQQLSDEQVAALHKDYPGLQETRLDGKRLLLFRGRVLVHESAAELREQLFEEFHAPLHDSIRACLDRVRNAGVHIAGAERFGAAWYAGCSCQFARAPRDFRNVAPLILPPRYPPLHLVQVDYLTVQEGTGGYMGLIVCVDDATRYTMATPVKKMDSATAVAAMRQWAATLARPKLIGVDGGSHFKDQFQKWCDESGVQLMVGTAHHHRGRGLVENSNKRLLEAIRRLCPQGKMEMWPGLFPELNGLINNSPSLARGGFTPAELLLVGTPSAAQALLGRVDEQTLEEMREFTCAMNEWARRAQEMHAVLSKVRHDWVLEDFNPRTGEALRAGDWVLLYDPLRVNKMADFYKGPYVVTDVEVGPSGAPTGWFTAGEVLGGIEEGQPGYPARGPLRQYNVDRAWPFDHSRLTADELHARALPDGWFTVRAVVSGPREDGRFEVRWAHQEETTWEFASTLAHSTPFRRYCEERKFDLARLAEMQKVAAVAGGPPPAAVAGGPRPARAGGVTVLPRCPVCKRVCGLVKVGSDLVVDGRHLAKCPGKGQLPE